ncbi:MAG: Glycosyltransferase [Deltaproteobacteria bacterium]|nr:Glycosyltransferase [Deltaproteobacteria bacterium]
MTRNISVRRAVVTIIAKNYLALAKTLANSLRQFHPDIDFHLVVIDRPGFPRGDIDPASIFVIDPLAIMDGAQFNSMAERYDITELSTSVKPFALQHLLDIGYEQVIYFDPDILIMQPLDQILDALDEANIVLTPHLLDPIPMDGRLPDEPYILKAGAYNLGFVGVKASRETRRFLKWWSERMETLCKIAPHRGLFVDQKWIDLVPGLFDGVTLLKHRGCNVAYWNVHSRRLVEEDGRYYVGEERAPLVFYHFSGYRIDEPDSLSKHQNRIDLKHEPALSGLLRRYASLLEANGRNRYKALPFTPWAPSGVNVAGYLTAELGVGEAARGYVASLKQLGIGIALTDFAHGTSSRKSDASLSGFAPGNPYPVNLICVNADQVEHFINHVGTKYVDNKVNIGVWWWELPRFPEMWKDRFRHFDQIWVGSEFARAAVQAATTVPVVRIPPVVEVKLEHRYSKAHFGLDGNEYVFLFVFDFFSIFERKNPLAIVRAFKRTFSVNEPARLVLKCINESHDPNNLRRLEEEIGGARVTLMKGYLSKDEKNGLIAAADCYVSLHRSEGFGYTMAEAMYLGKPVIATGWSGNTDFMSANNSYLVDYSLAKIDADYGPYERGQTWADPDIAHAASLMRRVVDMRAEAETKGKQAASDIRAKHSVTAVAAIIRDRLYDLPQPARKRIKRQFRQLMVRVFASSRLRSWMAAINRRVPSRFGMAVKSFLVKAGWY